MSNNTNSTRIKEEIIESLRSHPEGLTFRDISESVNHHRHTVTKYVYELIGASVISQRDIGAAKLCYLSEEFKGPDASKKMKDLKSRWKGQAQLVALFVLLLLIPTTIIVAQNVTNSPIGLEGMLSASNFSEINIDNIEFDSEEKTTLDEYVTPSNNGVENTTSIENENNTSSTEDENATQQLNLTIGNATEVNQTSNETEIQFNETINSTQVDLNLTLPIVDDLNHTVADSNITNITENETNISQGNITEDKLEPELTVEISSPEKITRGEQIQISVVIENEEKDVENIVIEWVLPDSFEIIEGERRIEIPEIKKGSKLSSELTILGKKESILGKNEINVRVSYE